MQHDSYEPEYLRKILTDVKTIALLVILFVMLYVGMNNGHEIDFHFPIAGTTAKTPIHASAALIYFGVFAVGVLAGTLILK